MDQSSMFYEGLFGSDSSESESESESPVLFGSLFGSSSSESESEYESEVPVFEFGSSPIIPPLLSPLRQTRPPTPPTPPTDPDLTPIQLKYLVYRNVDPRLVVDIPPQSEHLLHTPDRINKRLKRDRPTVLNQSPNVRRRLYNSPNRTNTPPPSYPTPPTSPFPVLSPLLSPVSSPRRFPNSPYELYDNPDGCIDWVNINWIDELERMDNEEYKKRNEGKVEHDSE